MSVVVGGNYGKECWLDCSHFVLFLFLLLKMITQEARGNCELHFSGVSNQPPIPYPSCLSGLEEEKKKLLPESGRQ